MTAKNPSLEPFKIGYLQDWIIASQVFTDQFEMSQLAFDEAYESGLIDRPVEILLREVEGPPHGQVAPVVDAWLDLALKEKCLAIIGPQITDVTKPVRRYIEEHRVPTLSHCATYLYPGDYSFTIPNGTFIDETALICDHLVKLGIHTVAVLREDNSMADEYIDYFRHNARLRGITIVTDQLIPTFVRDRNAEVKPKLKAIKDSGAGALAYLAYGMTLFEVAEAYREVAAAWDWDIPRVTITTWVGITCPRFTYFPVDFSQNPGLVEGWVGVDQIHEGNVTFQAVLDRFEKKHGRRPFHCYASCGYDMANAIAVALSRAKSHTPEGVKVALESIRMLPATTGGPGTVISFGPGDRRGFKGVDYVVLRTVKDGVERLAAEVFPQYSAV